jgi:MFS family permease
MNQFGADLSIPPSAASSDNRRVKIALYLAASFLYWIGLYLYVPTLPVYVQSKTDSLATVGIILAMYGLVQVIIRLPLGIAADWMGRLKPFIIVGFALTGLGAGIMGMATDANWLMVGRAVTGLAAAAWVPLVVVFSNLFRPREAIRAVALLNLTGSVGRVLATGVNGTLNELGGYSLAFLLAAGAAVVAILVVLPIKERRRPTQRPSLGRVSQLVSRRDVLLPSLLSAVGQYASWAITYSFIPIRARQLGATDVVISLLTSMYIAVYTLGNVLATAIVNRIGARRLIYTSFVILSTGIGGAALSHNLLSLLVAQLGLGFAMGIGYPVLMGLSIQRVDTSERTTAMGLHQAVYAVGMFAGPGLSGTLADVMGIRPMFGVTALFCLVAGLLGTRWLEVLPKNQPKSGPGV